MPGDQGATRHQGIIAVNFQFALDALVSGHTAKREIWVRINYIFQMPVIDVPIKGRAAVSRPFFSAMMHSGEIQPGWLPSTEDLLASDWKSEATGERLEE